MTLNPRPHSETTLMYRLLLKAPERLPSLRLFRRNISVVKVDGRTIRSGVRGACDLYGVLLGGRIVEIELKSATGVLSKGQAERLQWCRLWNVPHIILKALKGEAPDATVDRWLYELEILVQSLGYSVATGLPVPPF